MTPDRILVPASVLEVDYPDDAVMAVVDYVNELRAQLWNEDEIAEIAWQIYYADFYEAQVRNGGHSQFFFNARPWPEVSRLARGGLLVVGASQQAAILDAAVALVRREPGLLERLEETAYFGAAAEVAPSFSALDDALLEIPDEAAWPSSCRAWLRVSPAVEALDEGAYESRLRALREAVPDREARQCAADAAREANMPTWERAIRDACRDRGLEYQGLTAGTPSEDGTMRWSFFASGRRREAVVSGLDLLDLDWAPVEPALSPLARDLMESMLGGKKKS